MKNNLSPACFFKKALTINCKSILSGLKINFEFKKGVGIAIKSKETSS